MRIVKLIALRLIAVPFESLVALAGLYFPVIGQLLSIALLICIARFIERQRSENYYDFNAVLFLVCAYGTGLAESFIFFKIIENDSPGFNFSGLFGVIVFLNQVVLTNIGVFVTMTAVNRERDQQIKYYSDFPDLDNFSNDDKKV